MILLTLLLAAIFIISPVNSSGREIDEIDELRREITLLNLINGLNLTDSQSKELLKYADEAKVIKDSAKGEYDSMNGELKEAFTALRDNLYDKNLRPQHDIERRAAEINHRLKEKREGVIKQIKDIEEKVKSILTPGQVEIVQNFKPCLIPPKDLKNPERAGQAFDSSPAEKLLERIRSIPEARYATVRNRITDKYIKKIELHTGKMSEQEKEVKGAIFLETVKSARAMSDEDFALNKRELALQISPDAEKDTLKKRIETEKSRKDIGKIGRLLLDEKVITILEKRLEASKGEGHTGSSGLLSISENSKNNVCIVKTR